MVFSLLAEAKGREDYVSQAHDDQGYGSPDLAVVPRGQIYSAYVLQLEVFSARMLLDDDPHQDHVEYEQDCGEVQVVDVVQERNDVTQTELEDEVQNNVYRDDDLSSDSRNLLPEEAAQRQTKIGVLNAAKAEFTKLVMPPM